MRRGCELSQGAEKFCVDPPLIDNAKGSVCVLFSTNTLHEIIARLIFLSKQFCNFSPAAENKKGVGVCGKERERKRQRLCAACKCVASSTISNKPPLCCSDNISQNFLRD